MTKTYAREMQKKFINDLERVHPLARKVDKRKSDEVR